MGLVRLWVGADWRQRWRAHVALALLIAAVAAVVLTVAAGARQTSLAYQRFVDHQGVPDFEVDSLPPPAQAALARLPEVQQAAASQALFAAPTRDGLVPGQDFIVFAAADDVAFRRSDRPILVKGRLANPRAADEVVVNEAASRSLHLEIGTRTKLTSLGADEMELVQAGRFQDINFHGAQPTVRIVGVVRTRLDLGHASFARNYFLATPAFQRAYASDIGSFPPLFDVRLKPGASTAKFLADGAAAVKPFGVAEFGPNPVRSGLTSIRDASRVQTIALALVALAAWAAALVVLAQVISRSVAAMSPSFASLRAVGVSSTTRAGLVSASLLVPALAGAVVGVVVAWVGSPLFPTGVARRTGPPPARSFDAATLLLGGLAAAVVVVGVGAWAAFRWRLASDARAGSWRLGAFDRAAGGLPPAPQVGLRWALPRPDAIGGRRRAAILSAVVGVAALAGALTYRSSLRHLARTPSAYGWSFDVDAGGGDDDAQSLQRRDQLLADPVVGDLAMVRIIGSIPVGVRGDVVDAYGFEPVRGRLLPTVLEGRFPSGLDEIVVGTKTARRLHLRIGGTLTLVNPNGGDHRFRITGLGLLPTIEGDRFAEGVALTRPGLEQLGGGGYLEAVFRFAPGVDPKKALPHLREANNVNNLAVPPGDVRNLELVRAYPLWLAGFLAVLGLLAVLHGILVSARRRQHQVGILRAIGFTRRQVVVAAGTQGAATCIAGLVVGVPVGMAVGRWTWAASAHQLGVATVVVPPALALLSTGLAALLVVLAAGSMAGWWIGRSSAARFLRTP